MHKPFVLIPEWLDPSMEVPVARNHHHQQQHTLGKGKATGFDEALAFQLLCFESLYRLGLSDRQVVEVTAVTILLHKKFGHVTLVPMTRERVMVWKEANKGNPRWFRVKREFYWVFENTGEFFKEWLAVNLPHDDPKSGIGAMFWAGNPEWPLIFLGGDLTEFHKLVELVKIIFAQHCFKLPVTGTWSRECIVTCKLFQEKFPKRLLPWKNGKLDGFTYRIIALRWKRKQGLQGTRLLS